MTIHIKHNDRTMRDLMRLESEDNLNKPFGGKLVVLGGQALQEVVVGGQGDFRQILPAVRQALQENRVLPANFFIGENSIFGGFFFRLYVFDGFFKLLADL